MEPGLNIPQIARLCHEANREYCVVHDDHSQSSWEDSPLSIRQSAIAGVRFRYENPTATPQAQHDAWMAERIRDGWTLGEVKDPVKKTHPCLVPYSELPDYQRYKDELFMAVCGALKPFWDQDLNYA